MDPLYLILMYDGASSLHPIELILCGSTVLHVSSNVLSRDCADPVYAEWLCYVAGIIHQNGLKTGVNCILIFVHETTSHVHQRYISMYGFHLVWIFSIELSPDGTGPLCWTC